MKTKQEEEKVKVVVYYCHWQVCTPLYNYVDGRFVLMVINTQSETLVIRKISQGSRLSRQPKDFSY